ncbi:MAG: RNA polymerase sigma factor [Nannocystaceae bacterium]|nr:RNA polymerase sigma factor [Nannocystaceae bacterium]
MYEAHVDWLVQTLGRLGVRPNDRDDLAHDVFVVVHRKFTTFDSMRPVRPWLFGIAYRVVSEDRRRARHRYEVTASSGVDWADPRSGLEAQAAARHRLALVRAVLDRMSYMRRAVFIMHEFDGFSVPDIAEAVGVPLNTSYSHLRRARQEFEVAALELGLIEEDDNG